MFFFFIGGVRQQVTEILQRDAGHCLRCTYPANLVSYENVLELFFFPVWRWPSKQPALHCSNCGFLVPSGHFEAPPGKPSAPDAPPPSACWSCKRSLQPSFKFCPDCGARQEF
eukprot:c17477_g1_i1 orf=158-496(+)